MKRFSGMRSFPKIFLLSAFLSLSLAGCSKKSNTAEPVTPSSVPLGSTEGTPPLNCPEGGMPQAEGLACGAIYKGCCFPDSIAACASAGCSETCIQAESMPVQVSCSDAITQPAPATPNP